MDLVTVIMTAITSAIAASTANVASQAIKDSYAGLKRFLQDRYDLSLTGLERNHNSKAQSDAVAETLVSAKADTDMELVEQAKTLISLMQRDSQTRHFVGDIIIEDVEARNGSVTLQHIRGDNNVHISGITAGAKGSSPNQDDPNQERPTDPNRTG